MNTSFFIDMAGYGILTAYALVSLIGLLGGITCLKQREYIGAFNFFTVSFMCITTGIIWSTDVIDDLILSFIKWY